MTTAVMLFLIMTDAIVFQEGQEQTRTVVVVLFLVLATALGAAGLAMLIIGSVRWAMYGKKGAAAASGGVGGDEVATLLRSINERVLLSDTAKRIAYRHEDIQSLRKTIKEDVQKRRFDAAMALVAELSQTYGYLEEAENFRDQIHAARVAEQEEKINAAIANLDDILARHDYEKAGREAAKIQRLYPDSDKVKKLVRRVIESREAYKKQLERDFLAAAERDEVDRAIELLKEMDRYLTEQEAEPYREVARGVIGKKRDNLGVQFKIAVHDKEWMRAVRVGEQIIAEFPNTKMADEVRNMLDLLRERAAGQQAAQVR